MKDWFTPEWEHPCNILLFHKFLHWNKNITGFFW